MARFGEWIEIKTRPLTEEEKAYYSQSEYYNYAEPTFIYDCELPNCEQEVLITTRGGFLEKTLFCDDCGCYFEQFEDEDVVVAWMPLPDKYVKESKSGLPTIKDESYNQALEDLQNMIDNEYYDGGYGTYHDVEMITRMIEQLKK